MLYDCLKLIRRLLFMHVVHAILDNEILLYFTVYRLAFKRDNYTIPIKLHKNLELLTKYQMISPLQTKLGSSALFLLSN